MVLITPSHRTATGRVAEWLLLRPGEGRLVAYLTFVYLLLGLGMALGHGSSEALFLKRVGIEYLPHVFIGTGVALALTSVVYAEFVDRLRPGRMMQWLFLALGAFLLVNGSYIALRADTMAFAMYLLGYGVIAEIVVVHFNLYLASFLDAMQAARLSPLINAGARVGAIVGGVLLGLSLWPTEYTAFAWLGVLAAAAAVVGRHHRGEPGRNPVPARRAATGRLGHLVEGLRFAQHSRLLKYTAFALFLLIVLFALQDYLVNAILSAHFADETALAAFFGWFYAAVNLVVLLLQATVTGRLLRRFGLNAVNLIFPFSSLVGFLALALSQSLTSAVFARFSALGALRAFRVPAANLFYNALPAFMQGRARALNLALIVPLGLVTAGAFLIVIPDDVSLTLLAVAGIAMSVLGIYVKAGKNRAFGESLIGLIRAQVFSRRDARDGFDFGRLDAEIVAQLVTLVRDANDEQERLAYFDILMRGAPGAIAAVLGEIEPRLGPGAKDRLLRTLASAQAPGWAAYAHRCLATGDAHLKATALACLSRARDPHAQALTRDWLDQHHPRLQAAAIGAALAMDDDNVKAVARDRLDALLGVGDPAALLAGLSVAGATPDAARPQRVYALLQSDDARVRAAAVACCATPATAPDEIQAALSRATADPAPVVRVAAMQAAAAHPVPDERLRLIARGLDDPDPTVRRAAADGARPAMPATAAGYRDALARYFAHFDMQAVICRHLADSPLPERHALLVRSAERHVRVAEEKHALRAALAHARSDTAAAGELLALALAEESERHMDHALSALEALDERHAVHAIRAALASRDRRLRAQALESLRHLEHSALVARLVAFLDRRAPAATGIADVGRVLDYCEHSGSEWLKCCARAWHAQAGGAVATPT